MCATTYKGVVFHIVGLLSLEWEPLSSTDMPTYELDHLWLPHKRIPTYHPSNTSPPLPQPEERAGTHGLCPMCNTQGFNLWDL